MSDVAHPHITPESEPHWEGLRNGRLLLQKCTSCGKVRHYPRPVCPHCFNLEHDWVEAEGSGKLHSWTVCHHAFQKSWTDQLPYVLGIVDLPEGVRIQTRLRDVPIDMLKIGLDLKVRFHRIDDELTLPEFGPVAQPTSASEKEVDDAKGNVRH